MLEGAFQKLPDKVDNLILHSDQAGNTNEVLPESTESKRNYAKYVSESHLFGQCCAENFFGLLKTELFYLEKFDSIDQLEKATLSNYNRQLQQPPERN